MFDHVTDVETSREKKPGKNQKHRIEENSSDDETLEVVEPIGIFKYNVALFENIIGYDSIKKIFLFAIRSHLPVHILLIGPPGSAKTLFLMECMKIQRSYFTSGGHGTKAGMLDSLFKHRPWSLIIDEIEYMPFKDQAAL